MRWENQHKTGVSQCIHRLVLSQDFHGRYRQADCIFCASWCALGRKIYRFTGVGLFLVCRHGVGILKKLIHMGDLQRGADARVHTNQQKAVTLLLVGHIRAYKRPDSRGVRVGNVSEIENQQVGMVGPHSRLEIEEI
jgi:hypothetical protein